MRASKIDLDDDGIKQEWENLGRELEMYELVWFEITEKGKQEFEYLNSLSELQTEEKNYYIRICEGGQKAAEKLLNKLRQA